MSTLSDQVAVKIAEKSYVRNVKVVTLERDDKIVNYNVIETIEDKLTGLHGYVLQNDQTNEVVISFEGTQTNIGWTQSVADIEKTY